ncbi:DNA repair protein RecO [Patescibacteria group bacterium]
MVYKTTGIIIGKRDLYEADRFLVIYTKDFGKILVKAKAVKKSQAKLKGHLELFAHSYLMIAQGRGLDIVTNAETIDNFSNLRNNLPCLAGAYCISEIIDRLIAGPEPDEDIWQLILSYFNMLNNKNIDIKLLLKGFSSKFLEFLGYGDFSQQDPYAFMCSDLGTDINSFEFLCNVDCMVK